jgi:hypothetical protein
MTVRPDPSFHAPPKLAMEAPPENFAYTLLLSASTKRAAPDSSFVRATRQGVAASNLYSNILSSDTSRRHDHLVGSGEQRRWRKCQKPPLGKNGQSLICKPSAVPVAFHIIDPSISCIRLRDQIESEVS